MEENILNKADVQKLYDAIHNSPNLAEELSENKSDMPMEYYAGRGISTWRFKVEKHTYTIDYHNSEIIETGADGAVKITLVADLNNELLNDFLNAANGKSNIILTRTKHVKGNNEEWYDLTEKYTNISGFNKTEYASRMQIGHVEFTGAYDFNGFSIVKSETQYEPETFCNW